MVRKELKRRQYCGFKLPPKAPPTKHLRFSSFFANIVINITNTHWFAHTSASIECIRRLLLKCAVVMDNHKNTTKTIITIIIK